MSVYSARVKVPRRCGADNTDGTAPFLLEEIMIDQIKAKSLKIAQASALKEGKRYVAFMFPKKQLSSLPAPVVVDCARLNKEGQPVVDTFNNDDVNVRMISGATKPKAKVTAEAKTSVKVVAPKAVVRVALADPFTDELLTKVKEKHT